MLTLFIMVYHLITLVEKIVCLRYCIAKRKQWDQWNCLHLKKSSLLLK